ncbi:MAG: alpha/beta hydrolase [Alphaproteobacteria bacterium]|nr:alpha/beta hydrolase [Alphaproteobacteria bacterium]
MPLSVDGHETQCRMFGQDAFAEGGAVLMVHGAAMDHSIWDPVLPALERHDRPYLAVDLPAHGGSAGGALATLADMGDWLARLADAAGMVRPVALGHSMGGAAVLEFAARHPEMGSAVGLLGVSARMPVHPDLLAMAENDPAAAGALVGKWAVAKDGPREAAEVAAALVARSAPGVLVSDLKACDSYQDGAASAGRLQCPALFILGEVDRMTPPADAEPLVGAAPCAHKSVLPGIGHMMTLEAPDATYAALDEFLGGVGEHSSK